MVKNKLTDATQLNVYFIYEDYKFNVTLYVF